MRAPERENSRRLINVFKNGIAVFEESNEKEISIYCQNFFTQEVFVIEKSFLKEESRNIKYYSSALCMPDEKTIKILIEVINRALKVGTKAVLIISARVLEGGRIELIDRNHIAIPADVMCIDKLGGRFHTIQACWLACTDLWDLSNPSAQKVSVMDKKIILNGLVPYDVTGGLLCLGLYDDSLLGSSYLKIFDIKKFKGISQAALIDIKINGAVHVVALSENRRFLAMSLKKGEYFYNDAKNTVYVNQCICPVEIWELGKTNRKLVTVDLKLYAENARGRLLAGKMNFVSMAISNEGDMACAVNKGYRGNGIYYYSLSRKKLWEGQLEKVEFAKESCFCPGYFIKDNKHFLFPASESSWCIFGMDESRSAFVMDSFFRVEDIPLSGKATNKAANPKLAREDLSSEPRNLFGSEGITLVRGNIADAKKDEADQLIHAKSGKGNKPVMPDYSWLPPLDEIPDDVVSTQVKHSQPPSPRAAVASTQRVSLPSESVTLDEPIFPLERVEVEEIGYDEFEPHEDGRKIKISETHAHIIYQVNWNAEMVALKVIKTAGDSDTNKNCLEREFNNLKLINHPQIIKTHGYSFDNARNFCLVLQYYSNGDLGQYIYNPGRWNNTQAWRYRCLVEVCEALDYLHSNRMVHLDIKPQNVFLDEHWHVVLGDFGLSVVLPQDRTHQSTNSMAKGTAAFMAPELLRRPPKGQRHAYRPSCDIYSLAFLMWCCEYQKRPFEEMAETEIAIHVQPCEEYPEGGREELSSEPPPRLARLITWCWHRHPNERPVISRVLQEMREVYTEELRNVRGIVSGPKPLRK